MARAGRPEATPVSGGYPPLAAVPGMPGRGPGMGAGPASRFGARVRPSDVRRTVRRIWAFFAGEQRRLTLIAFLIVAEAALGMAGPWLLGRAVDALSSIAGAATRASIKAAMSAPGPARALAAAAVALLAAYLGGALLSTFHGWIMAGVSQRMVRNVREGLFAKLQRLPLSFFDLRTHGDLMSRLSNDVDAVSVTVSQSAIQLMSSLVVVTGTLAIMLALNPLLTAASLVPVPLVLLLTSMISRRTRTLFKQQQDALGALNGHVEETVSGIQAVKAFGRERRCAEQFAGINERLRRVGTRAQIWTGFLMPMMNVIGNLAFTAVAVTGGVLAARGAVSVGVVATFIAYSRQFMRPLNEIA
ncbi:MAG: ABC transporter ATP-binding protein, partial [Spirochaetes bacterium]|nr:ABC transporter ATP-binding protein [Spirochaetota bacterium]